MESNNVPVRYRAFGVNDHFMLWIYRPGHTRLTMSRPGEQMLSEARPEFLGPGQYLHAVSRGNVTDAQILDLASLPRVAAVTIGSLDQITSVGFRRLGLLPELIELRIGGVLRSSVHDIKLLRLCRALTLLDISCVDMTDDFVLLLENMTDLQELRWGGRTTRKGLQVLTRLPKLRRLVTGDTYDTEWAAVIGSLTQLESLDVQFQYLTGEFLDAVANLKQMRQLSLHFGDDYYQGPRITERAFAGLAGLPKLEQLSISGVILNDPATLRAFAALPLARLELSGCKAPPEAWMALADLAPLTHLELLHCKGVTDAVLNRCGALPNLQSIRVHACPDVSPHWMKRFGRPGAVVKVAIQPWEGGPSIDDYKAAAAENPLIELYLP